MIFDPTEHPDFLRLATDLSADHDSLIRTIERARASAHQSHERYSVRKAEANTLAQALLDLIQTGTLIEVPGEQLIIQLALHSLIAQNDINQVAGSLKTKGRGPGSRLTRERLYMDALAYGFQLTKTKYVRLCSITDDQINEDTAEADYKKFIKNPKYDELIKLSKPFNDIAAQYGEQMFKKNITLTPLSKH
jgi:hypothetical protein